MSTWDTIKNKYSSGLDALAEWIEGQSTWDEMRDAGMPVGGTNEENAEFLAEFLGDPLNVAFTALGIGSSYKYILNPKKLLAHTKTVNAAHRSKTAKLLVEQEKIINNHVKNWETDFIKKNVIPQINSPVLDNADPIISKLRTLSKEDLFKLPNEAFHQSPELRRFINSFKGEMMAKKPWSYSDDLFRSIEKMKFDDALDVKNTLKNYETQLINDHNVIKEYGSLSPTTGRFVPASYDELTKISEKNISKLSDDVKDLKQNWEEVKDVDIFNFLK